MKLQSYGTLVMAVLLGLEPFSGSVLAAPQESNQAATERDVKVQIAELGAGKETRVAVRLRDGKKFKGHISAVNDESFLITNTKTGEPRVLRYENVGMVKRAGLSTGAKIGIWSGVAGGLFLLVSAVGCAIACDD